MRYDAILVPLQDLLRDTIMFCAFEKILEPTESKKNCWEQQLVGEKKQPV